MEPNRSDPDPDRAAPPVADAAIQPAGATLPSPMRDRVDGFDWSVTPLGARIGWPSELEIAVQQMLDSSFPKAIVWGPGLTTIYNDAFVPILGAKPDALGRSFADIWREVWHDIGPIAERTLAGLPSYFEDYPLTIDRSGRPEQAWFTFCYSPLRLADGSIAGMLDTVVETTDKVRAQADLALANQELGHRLKNTLGLVQAIAAQTLREETSPAAMDKFSSRLAALGHAHEILLRQDWSAASLSDVVAASIEPHDALGQVRFQGPDFQISSRAAVALSLMLHELATNAVKYGALSVPEGQVRLSWSIESDRMGLHWRESGGPPVSEPKASGFGLRLLNMGLGGQGEVKRRFEAKGFALDLHVPLPQIAS